MRHLEHFAPADDAKRHQETSGKDGAKYSKKCHWRALLGVHLPPRQGRALASISKAEVYWALPPAGDYDGPSQHQSACKFVASKHPPCMFLWILLTNHPHVSLQACSMVVQRAAIWRQVYRLTILLEVGQPGSVGRKMRPSVSMLFSWITSSAAWPTCRYGLLSRSPEARGNLVWCYTGRNNQEQ